MKKKVFTALAVILLLLGAIVAVALTHHEIGKRETQAAWDGRDMTRVAFTGAMGTLAVKPLVNWHAVDDRYRTEAGVSLLIETDGQKTLFDVGFNQSGLEESPLAHNVKVLELDLSDIDRVFLSHRHRDHIGGVDGEKSGQLILHTELGVPSNVPVFAPTELPEESREVIEADQPMLISAALASTGPIQRKLFLGRIDEQALVINVQDKGLALIVGCGHQTTDKLIQRVEESFDEPIFAIIGDLHFPIPEGRLSVFGLDAQRYLASGQGPLSPIGWQQIEAFAEWAAGNGVSLFLGGHDTSDEVLDYLANREDIKMQQLAVGRTSCVSC